MRTACGGNGGVWSGDEDASTCTWAIYDQDAEWDSLNTWGDQGLCGDRRLFVPHVVEHIDHRRGHQARLTRRLIPLRRILSPGQRHQLIGDGSDSLAA